MTDKVNKKLNGSGDLLANALRDAFSEIMNVTMSNTVEQMNTKLDGKFDAADEKMDAAVETMSGEMKSMESRLNSRIDDTNSRIDRIDSRLDNTDQKVGKILERRGT